MSEKIADPLAGLLFGQERELVNLKMMRGDAPHVTEKELRDEAHSAIFQAQLSSSTHKDFPESGDAERVDVLELAGRI